MQRKYILAVALLSLETFAGPARSQTAARIIGAGATANCAIWLSDRSGADLGVIQWALGFLSGVAGYSYEVSPLDGMDGRGVLDWLDKYCRNSPADEFVDALHAFIKAHPR